MQETVLDFDEESAKSDDQELKVATRHQMKGYITHLSRYIHDGRGMIQASQPRQGVSQFLLPSEVLTALQSWVSSPVSRTIWVQGAISTSHGSTLSRAALRLPQIILDSGLPCVSFFCKPLFEFPTTSPRLMTRQQKALVAFMYSVVAQLVHLLPHEIEMEATGSLSEEEFSLLDGTFDSIPAALRIIDGLLAQAPPTIIWVVDGLHLMESLETKLHLERVLQILRDEANKRVTKVCFTTDGNSAVLGRGLDSKEKIDAGRTVQGRAGKLLRGGGLVNSLR